MSIINNEQKASTNPMGLDQVPKASIALYETVEGLMSGKTYKTKENSLTFRQFLTFISEESFYSVTWKTMDINNKKLFLFTTDWKFINKLPESKNPMGEQHFINKYFNSLVIEVSLNSEISDSKNFDLEKSDIEYKIIMYGGPKIYDSNRDNITLSQIEEFVGNKELKNDLKTNIYEAYEGTTINAFYYENKWFFCTKRNFDMFDSKFANQQTHGAMIENMFINDTNMQKFKESLNTSYSYHFVLVHSNNAYINDIKQNKLVLFSVRKNKDLCVDTKEYSRVIEHKYFFQPIISNIEKFKNDEKTTTLNTTQGIIIIYNNLIFRIYSKTYGEFLKYNPLFNTNHEKYLYDYQNNKFSNQVINNVKTYTTAAYNFVAICLFRTLTHFTKFSNQFTNEEKLTGYKFIKKNIDDWHKYNNYSSSNNNALIRNIYKLQRIPYIIKNISVVNFEQVKHHLKYHCCPQDLYKMYNTFYKDLDENNINNQHEITLIAKIGYKPLHNTIANIKGFKTLL